MGRWCCPSSWTSRPRWPSPSGSRTCSPPQPLAQDLLGSVVTELGAKVTEVRIDDLRDDIYTGRVFLEQGKRKVTLDARPSDSIAMALDGKARIMVTRKVLDEAGISREEIDALREGGPGVGGSGDPNMMDEPDAAHGSAPGPAAAGAGPEAGARRRTRSASSAPREQDPAKAKARPPLQGRRAFSQRRDETLEMKTASPTPSLVARVARQVFPRTQSCQGGVGRLGCAPMRKAKIICTLGPSSDSAEVIEELIRAGMNVARLNFSHGTHDAAPPPGESHPPGREEAGRAGGHPPGHPGAEDPPGQVRGRVPGGEDGPDGDGDHARGAGPGRPHPHAHHARCPRTWSRATPSCWTTGGCG